MSKLKVVNMNRKEYYKFINVEVYGNKRNNFLRKIFLKHFSSSTNAVYLIRKYQKLFANKYTRKFSFLYLNKLRYKYGIFISPTTIIDIGLQLPHPDGIIFGASCRLGKNCTVYQQVTIGSARVGDVKMGLQPNIGENVYLFAGSKILGDITLANNTMVAANAVLLKDTEENGVYGGIPAKLISYQTK